VNDIKRKTQVSLNYEDRLGKKMMNISNIVTLSNTSHGFIAGRWETNLASNFILGVAMVADQGSCKARFRLEGGSKNSLDVDDTKKGFLQL
jgi:hypothetical protein